MANEATPQSVDAVSMPIKGSSGWMIFCLCACLTLGIVYSASGIPDCCNDPKVSPKPWHCSAVTELVGSFFSKSGP